MLGNKYNRWTVIKKNDTIDKIQSWICQCECGTIRAVRQPALINNTSMSCGCYRQELRTAKAKINPTNIFKTEYRIWVSMHQRCYNFNHPAFKNYGGRGIKVCDRWLNNFDNFLSDMGSRPSQKHSLDRYPNKNGNYEPDNCCWHLIGVQNRNKRTNIWIRFNNIQMVAKDWATLFNIHPTSLSKHLAKGKSLSEIQKIYAHKILFHDKMPKLEILHI